MPKLLFVSGDTALAQGKKSSFYYTLEEFSKYFDRVDVICPKTEQKIFQVHGNVFIHSSKKSRIFQPWFIMNKGQEIYKKEKFDIFGVHSYPPFYNDIGGKWLYNKIKTPYVLEVMHITGYPKAGNLKEWFYKILTRLFIKFFSKQAIAVRVINQKQVPEFLKSIGIEEKKIIYIHASYIDFDIFKPVETEKKYDIVFSGRLAKNKGIFLLLEAIKKLKVIIVGDGPLKPKIEKYISRKNLRENVVFSGWLSGAEDLAKIYNQSKILVMPSYNEGGPRVTLEAMACETPIITTRVGAMVDVIEHGENGLFIDWDAADIAEKILLLLENEDLRKKIAENGYLTAQQFERKKAIKNYAEMYKNLI